MLSLDVVELLEALVTIDSQNPSMQPESPGEGPLAQYVADWLEGHGIDVSLPRWTGGAMLGVAAARPPVRRAGGFRNLSQVVWTS